jgi:hypothetical protein
MARQDSVASGELRPASGARSQVTIICRSYCAMRMSDLEDLRCQTEHCVDNS